MQNTVELRFLRRLPSTLQHTHCDGRRARQSCTASAGAQAGAQHAPQGSESAQRRVPGFGPSRNSRDPTRCEGGAREQTFVPRQATPGARRPR